MGTQWVVRSKEAGRDVGSRGAYRPRHAKPRRHQAPVGYPGDQVSGLAEGEEPTGHLEAPGRRNDAYGQGSIGQVRRDQAASVGRDRSVGYADEQCIHQGPASLRKGPG